MITLVTGATGFVGSHTTDELLRRGVAVRALVRDAGKSADLDALAARGAEVVVGDIRDRSTLDRAVNGVSVIYHCAAAVGAHHSRAEIYSVNRDGVAQLLEAVRAAGKPRVVLLSSVNVLGTRDLDPATEDLPCQRSSDPAADVKIEAEQLALEAHRRHGLDVVIVRPGFIYGPRDTRNLPALASAIREGRFRFFGSRQHVVPIVYVGDVVQALVLAAQTPAANGRTYHITDGSRTTIGELVAYLAELQKCPPPERILALPLARFLCGVGTWMGRLGLRRNRPPVISPATLRFLGTSRWVDIGRATAELGYVPRVPWREGIAETVRWIEDFTRGQPRVAQSAS